MSMQQLTIFDVFEEMKVAPVGETCLNCSRFCFIESFDNKTYCRAGIISRNRVESSTATCKHFEKSTKHIPVWTSSYGFVAYYKEREMGFLND